MGEMPFYLFVASVIFAIGVARKKKIRALSPYGIFIAFQTLYNVMPWITASLEYNLGFYALLGDKHLVNIQLVLAAISNFCFGLVYLAFYRNVPFAPPKFVTSWRSRRNYILLVFPFFLVTVALCYKYGWHQFTFATHGDDSAVIGGMFTVTAYFKYFFVAIYLYYIYRFGLDKGAWILLGEHLIVMGVDGARSTFLPVLLVTLFVLLDTITNQSRIKRIYLLAIVGITLSIAARALILHASSLVQDMVLPVVVEGGMGDYPSLQSIQGVESMPNPHYTYGTSYILDPLVWLIPQSIGRKGLSPFENWTDSLSNVLEDKFAPMGGFYYISEAVAAFSYAGPAIVTLIFAGFLLWIELNKNRYRLLYLAWMPTIGILFVKMQFGNCFKLFAIQFLSIYLLSALSKIKVSLPQRPHNMKPSFVAVPN
jgi:hypothetical protein